MWLIWKKKFEKKEKENNFIDQWTDRKTDEDFTDE